MCLFETILLKVSVVKEEEGGGAGAPTQGLPIHGETNTGGGGVCTITHVPATVAEG